MGVAMKFYFISHHWYNKIPMNMYRNNILSIALLLEPRMRKYLLRLDFTNCDTIPHSMFIDFYFYNLTDEDLIHLNLLGVPIRPSRYIILPELTTAIQKNEKMFYTEKNWSREF